MSKELGITRDVWLFLLREGGRHNVPEIVKATGIDRKAVNNSVRCLRRHGAASEIHPDGEYARYGVTLDCALPRGVTLRDLRDAGAI